MVHEPPPSAKQARLIIPTGWVYDFPTSGSSEILMTAGKRRLLVDNKGTIEYTSEAVSSHIETSMKPPKILLMIPHSFVIKIADDPLDKRNLHPPTARNPD